MIINSHWHYPNPGPSGVTPVGGGVHFLEASQPNRWWLAAGAGGQAAYAFCQAINGQWEGNPDQFLRMTWIAAPTQGDGHYQPLGLFRNTILEHKMNRARMFAGKLVTLSWLLRSAGGAPVGLCVWRHYTNHPFEIFSSPSISLAPGVVQRCDYTFVLPPVPTGYDVDTYSYIGVGVDLIGQTGPEIDFGPCQFNELGPQPFREKKYEQERLLALQPYP